MCAPVLVTLQVCPVVKKKVEKYCSRSFFLVGLRTFQLYLIIHSDAKNHRIAVFSISEIVEIFDIYLHYHICVLGIYSSISDDCDQKYPARIISRNKHWLNSHPHSIHWAFFRFYGIWEQKTMTAGTAPRL